MTNGRVKTGPHLIQSTICVCNFSLSCTSQINILFYFRMLSYSEKFFLTILLVIIVARYADSARGGGGGGRAGGKGGRGGTRGRYGSRMPILINHKNMASANYYDHKDVSIQNKPFYT